MPKKKPRRKKLDPDALFNKCWQLTMIEAHRTAPSPIPASMKPPGLIKAERRSISELFKIKRVHQKLVFDIMVEALEGRRVLIDLLSGDATATLPLVASGKLDRLVLVDNNASPTLNQHTRVVADKMKITSRVEWMDMTIGSRVQEGALPDIPDVLLAESGIAIPPRYRYPGVTELRPEEQIHPPAYKNSHVIDMRTTIGDVLRDLGHMPGRRVHLIDSPFYRYNTDSGDIREHVEGQMGDHPEWNIDVWGAFGPNDSMIYGCLEHE